MTFRVGQKVVCVNDVFSPSWDIPHGIINRPRANGIYTIRSIGEFNFITETCSAVWLDEIVNPIVDWKLNGPKEIGFWLLRFRPAVERKTDISIFTKMLTGKKTGVRA